MHIDPPKNNNIARLYKARSIIGAFNQYLIIHLVSFIQSPFYGPIIKKGGLILIFNGYNFEQLFFLLRFRSARNGKRHVE